MILKNSIKQMLRTPIRTFLFLFLITVSGIFLSVGGNLWMKNQMNIKNYEDIFVTIGTVTQKPSSIAQELEWNAEKKDYIIRQWPVYSELYPVTILPDQGVDYIHQPEKRSYYGSYVPEYRLRKDEDNIDQSFIAAEISPREDCIPEESVQVDIKKVIGGDQRMEGMTVWFCNHTQKNPEPLYKDKTYVVLMIWGAHWTHGEKYESKKGAQDRTLEYGPGLPAPIQYTGDGTRMKSGLDEFFMADPPLYFELEEGFYETDLGRHYLNIGPGHTMLHKTLPVTGTNSTLLLMPFYTEDAFIYEGRDISEGEYKTGEKVCLVSKKFAENNELSTGDYVQTRFYYTNSRNPASGNFTKGGYGGGINRIDIHGYPPEVFEESQYTIVGIYDVASGMDGNEYDMGDNEMIVPMNSIEHRNKYYIFNYGPMRGSTTSFQIPNGTIDSFMKEWGKLGIEDVEITFYDRGYSQLENGIENMKYMSLILFTVGIGMSISLIFLYSHLLITNQRQRTAIERSLGVSSKKCRYSLLFSLLLVLFLGSVLGCGTGGILSEKIGTSDLNQIYYDKTYSNIAEVETKENIMDVSENQNIILIVTISCTGFIILLGMIISLSKINRSLKLEPMKLLST